MSSTRNGKRRTVQFARTPSPEPNSAPKVSMQPHQFLSIDSGSWIDVPINADSKPDETIEISPVPIPTNIHLDLVRAKIIQDPRVGTNERDVQWIHEREWRFSTRFYLTVPKLVDCKTVLVFEGLDTFATVLLNGKEILKSENMFLSYRVDVTNDVLLMGKANEITIIFDSAMVRGGELMKEHGQRVCWNGHYSRPYVRKAQYHYGWDWGPSLVTCGPWRPISVEVYTARLSDSRAVATVAADLASATINLQTKVDSIETTEDITITADVRSPSGEEFSTILSKVDDIYSSTVTIPDPELWFPHNYGPQNLYEVVFTLKSGDMELHSFIKQIGLRKIELVQDPLPVIPDDNLSGGTTFYFRINNVPVFSGGSNWIPADSFQPAIKREAIENMIDLMVRGNQNMVRVWGGGIYESEDFYSLCDLNGIMVWQDICCACADYPAHLDNFANSILAEVEQQLGRLHWHPSLIFIAGNNEDYQVADEEVGYDKDAPPETWREEPFPARWLYERKFPELVRSICQDTVVYWPGSPFGGEDSTDRTVGDIHQWNIWGGIQAPYQRYPDLGGRFVSEFGMPSFPSPATMALISDTDDEPHPQSYAVAHHIKAHSFEKRMYPYILENFQLSRASLNETIFLSQLVQAEAMAAAFKGWRAKWDIRHCGGALVWQLNDVWPAVSWSITSYAESQPKPAFYAISRALAPVSVISRRFSNDPKPNSKVEALCANKTAKAGAAKLHSTPHTYPEKQSEVEVKVSNITKEEWSGVVDVKFISVETGVETGVVHEEVNVPANGAMAVGRWVVREDEPTLVVTTLVDEDDEVVSREINWPEPFKFVGNGGAFCGGERVNVEWRGGGVRVMATEATKGLWFEEIPGEVWEDNGIDLVPGEDRLIRVENLLQAPERRMWWYGGF
ncbi:glycoside hydrolase superfamily [Pyronema domesticum]|uniref:Beta-mannosidase B n=1 Tax=Pyronema omphalodes (strain CBS 100304) TaxID=1076935 RepID=U4LJD6_PYROM|nr:glycoside hydrolase superfamily [Pyronema domesticum]CCX32063.1 Similar to Probable beta-mannosidase B; acc. no. B8NW36 [Pyronema omphalodes CBS 100304]